MNDYSISDFHLCSLIYYAKITAKKSSNKQDIETKLATIYFLLIFH